MAAKSNIMHFIFASSSSVYGDMNIPINGLKENMIEGNVQSVYAMTKVANEIEALVFQRNLKCRLLDLDSFLFMDHMDDQIWQFGYSPIPY